MDWKIERFHQSVRENYQVLLLSDAEIEIPEEKEKIFSFYRSMVDTWMEYEKSVGEEIRREYLSAVSMEGRRFFRTKHRKLSVKPLRKDSDCCAFLSEYRTSEGIRKAVQYWDVSSELMIPPPQILHQLKVKVSKGFSSADFYDEGEKVVFFKNQKNFSGFSESVVPMVSEKN